ncbi:hypothetical protein [Microbacterium sp. SORGH_AS_0888]|uniref:hypothetical protein n=1 Tax=Microbacterium sp. SORGH_AS_0888 TaxID=3041791 RepID=UPI0027801DF3|nr:hypothetical protein [Microbacterium sp. SORGH_AS_0888]MDQ1129038.1 hypothetical protein [Microbacterium sp. SORGH_AS_0888]
MKISLKKAAAAVLAVSVGLGAAGLSATAANAAVGDWTPDGTPEPYFLYSLDTGAVVPSGTQLEYTSGLVAAPSPTDPDQRFADAPSDATSTYIFIAPYGGESTISQWLSKVDIGFEPGTKRAYQPTAQLSQFPASTFGAVKAAGGDYSLGIAYTKNNGVTFVGLGAFVHVHITAGSGAWTYDYPTAIAPQPAADTTGDIALSAPVVLPPDGALSLTVPSGATAALGSATIANGQSTATGTLPTFSVNDKRYSAKPGWTVNASVAQFASGSNVFNPNALSIVPAIVSGSTAPGVTTVASLVGSTTAAKFAEAAAGAGVGVTNLNAALTLAAPVGTPAGTYTSTMTVTVVSK